MRIPLGLGRTGSCSRCNSAAILGNIAPSFRYLCNLAEILTRTSRIILHLRDKRRQFGGVRLFVSSC